MQFRLRTLLIVLAVGLFAGCSGTNRPTASTGTQISTSPAREAEILQAAGELKPGMTAAEVEQLMGEPDGVQPLYEPVIKNPKQVGITNWYILEGSTAELAASKAVRVALDLEDRVTRVDRLRVDGASPAP
jgi:hypothetical protein